MSFNKVKNELIFSKNDPQDLRLGDIVKEIDSIDDYTDFWVIGGYPDDEGIKANGGRVGAKLAPSTIRKYFYKMTPNVLAESMPKFTDVGDFNIEGTLDERQSKAIKEVTKILSKGAKYIGLGGGHDWGFVDGSAYLDTFTDKPLMINFDAHLDVRPDHKGTNSGTPFYRLLNKYPNVEFYEIGIQSQCNSKSHVNWLTEKGGKILYYDELMLSNQPTSEKILNFLETAIRKKRKAFISIDIDAFSSAWAPGCSQSFATGFNPDDFFRVFEVLKERLDIRVMGIYEVSPPLDQDDRTSKLAAQILHRFL